jgi:DNA (cytosine-5)-methyltransferase 1
MPLVGLFAGIGGLELGFAEAGIPSTLLAEIDPAAGTVLKHHFPEARLVEDVSELSDLPGDTRVVTAGFPCQNLSMAGDKRGIHGAKSNVVSKLFRLIDRSRVPTVVIENVYFMLQLDRGRAMDALTSQFEDFGYRWAYRIVDTLAFGLPQRRRRVYLVGSKALDPRSVLFADETRPPPPSRATLEVPLGFYWTEGRSGVGITPNGIPPLKGGSGVGIPSPPAVLFPDGSVLMPSLTACERLQGFPPGWTQVLRTNFGRNPEWRLLGNAVSVPVAAWIASRLLQPGEPLQLETRALQPGSRWPDAAYNVDGRRIAAKATDKPFLLPIKSISDYRGSDWSHLSHRALSGFLERAIDGGLRFPPGFIDALQLARSSRAAA